MVWWAGCGGMVSSVVIMLDSSMREMLARYGYLMNKISLPWEIACSYEPMAEMATASGYSVLQ
jgi:hypothetical protein